MRCPTSAELPLPPQEKTGWPWTEAHPVLLDAAAHDSSWPRVSIVTPSYNQAEFLEETVRSVLLQGYPNLEYIVIDGGSTDNSVEIIRKYEPWLSYWVSERDNGQAQAINKGFKIASGDIVAWLNSDDTYLSGTIAHAVRSIKQYAASVVYSRCRMVTPEGNLLAIYDPEVPVTLQKLVMFWKYAYANPPQPTVFIRRQVLETVGLLDETLNYALDYEFWLRVAEQFNFAFVDATWANYVVHDKSKTGQGWKPFVEESFKAGRRYWRYLSLWDRFICHVGGHRLPSGRRYLDQAWDAYEAHNWADAQLWIWEAVRLDPSLLFHRGVLFLCRRLLGKCMVGRTKTLG